MTGLRSILALLLCSGSLVLQSGAQTSVSSPAPNQSSELLGLTRKIDEQNTRIDLLSQQILRLQQEIEHSKSSSNTNPTAAEPATPASTAGPGGSTHVVARGETLTSIAKMHKVGIDELQKFNHIENDRKLQIGQTLVIPGAQPAAPASSPATSPSPSASPNG
jgi:LysM repeat protein